MAALATALACAMPQAKAQMGKLFNADRQLSSSFVNQVYLDRDGLIWVATRNGLCRYDGYQFRNIKKEDTPGMASNSVNCIVQDRKGVFFLGMYGVLQSYDGSAFNTVSIRDKGGNELPCYVNTFVQRKNGDLLAGTSSLGVLVLDNPKQAHQAEGALAGYKNIIFLMEDHLERLWIATDKGLLLYNNGRILRRFFEGKQDAASIKCVCEDRQGRVYVGTSDKGVYRLQGSDFERIPGTEDFVVASMFCCKDGRMMIGLDGAGVAVYRPENGLMGLNPFYSKDMDLNHAKVYSIIEDNGGNIWLGMLQKGIFMQPAGTPDFMYMGYKLGERNVIGDACITATVVDAKGRIFVGTDKDGLYQFSPQRQLEAHYTDGVPSTVLSMDVDYHGHVWIGSWQQGCGWLDPDTKRYHDVPLPLGPSVSVFGVQDDGRGHMWLATMGQGLIRVSLADNSLKTYRADVAAYKNHGINSIVNDFISKLSVSPDHKRVYLATTTGVSCLDIDSESWVKTFGKNCLLYGTPIRVVRELGGSLWIGTNDGLYNYDLLSGNIKRYDKETGLCENGIASVEQDDNGLVWVGTDHGLCCLNPSTGQTDSYFVDNGLQSNEFSDDASFKRDNGVLIFGGVGGITWFDPKAIHPHDWNAKVRLTALIINGQPADKTTKSGRYQVCDSTVLHSDKFQLAYRDNSFTLQLSTLTYDNPEQIVYYYRINGEPEAHLQPGQNEITFSHLSPGRYKFRVRAVHNNLSTPEHVFTVVVHAPWWRSWPAYLTYMIIMALILWQYLMYRKAKERDRLKLQEHMHAEQLGEAKLSSFMNISHEIRTPMTLILTPLNTLIKSDKNPERMSLYVTMRRNAERILGLINQMMDLRKIDKGMMQMRMQQTDLVGFLDDINSLFAHHARAKQVDFTYSHDDDKLMVWVDRTNFDKVIVNLLSNAFKFVPNGGKILMTEQHDDNDAIIRICNNGEPIPEDRLETIFKRFYQAPSNVNDRNVGTGIGLDLTRSLVELHHGSIKADNVKRDNDGEVGTWVEFTVRIPLGKQHLKPDEIIEPGHDVHKQAADEVPDDDGPVAAVVDNNRPFSIVVAEDDDEIREYLGQELANGFVVRCCANGKEALAAVLKDMPDLVISDIMMPEMDGNTLSATIKQNPHTNHIPVILLTAKNRDEDQLEGLETGADAYIIKPFNMEILRRTAVNLIQSHRKLMLKYSRNDRLEDKVTAVTVKAPDEKLLERIMAVVNKNLSNSSLNVDTLAEEVGLSRVHLHRKMKELTGQTPHDFVRNIRLKQAANLLSEGNMNISEIVYACGFGNTASFATVFKKYYGMTPREFMQQHKKEV